ncbi:MAG: hypothetical protein SV375_00010 [Thermodesulfobacteriota bacterium]|nr:hypothetical protein [Thermodesulfobacteriota bacterium]
MNNFGHKVVQLDTGYLPDDTGETREILRREVLDALDQANGHFDPAMQEIIRIYNAFRVARDILRAED